MATATQRLQRRLKDELEDCRPKDVEQRLDELDTLEEVLSTSRIERHHGVLTALANETRYKLVWLFMIADGEFCGRVLRHPPRTRFSRDGA